MSLQPILLIDLALGALLYTVAALLLRWRGMRTKRWYAFLGGALLSFALFGVLGVLLEDQQAVSTGAIFCGMLSIVFALVSRSPTGQGNAP